MKNHLNRKVKILCFKNKKKSIQRKCKKLNKIGIIVFLIMRKLKILYLS